MNVSITLSIGRIEHEGKADGWDLILVSLISRRKDTDLGKANVRSMYPSGVGKGLKPRIRLTNRWLSMKKDQATVAVVKYSNVFASGEFEYQSLQLTSVVVGYAGDLVLMVWKRNVVTVLWARNWKRSELKWTRILVQEKQPTR
ncbi:hypothetical protein Tco_0011948 [Tanacetum coccineum]